MKIDCASIVLFSIPVKSGESIAPPPLSPKHPPAQKGIMYAQSCNTEHFFPLQYGLLQGSIETSGRTIMRCIKKPMLKSMFRLTYAIGSFDVINT